MSKQSSAVTTVPAVFQFENHNVRTIEKNGGVWFVLKDVCQALTINNVSDVAKRLDDDEKEIDTIDTLGGTQETTVINESGLYSAIMRSAKPEAKRFKKWVTSEVLPSIRKHGSYGAPLSPVALPTQPMELLFLAVDSIKQLNERTLQIESRTERVETIALEVNRRSERVEDLVLETAIELDEFKNNRPLEQWQAFAVKQAMQTKVYELHDKYGINTRMLFSSCWGFLKRHFKVPTFSGIPSRRYDETILVVKNLALDQLPPTIIELARGTKRTPKTVQEVAK